MRRTLILALCGFTATLLLLLNSQTFLLHVLSFVVAEFTEFRVELREPHINAFSGAFTASELQLFPDSGGPPLLSITELEGKIGSLDFFYGDLSNSSLSAKNIQLYIPENNSGSAPEPLEWIEYLSFLPHTLEADQIHLILEALKTWVFTLQNISGVRNANINYRLSAGSDYGGQKLEFAIELLTVFEKETLAGLRLQGEVNAAVSNDRLEFSGQLLGDEELFTYDLEVDSHTAHIERFLSAAGKNFDLQGTMRLTGRVEGNTRGFTVVDTSAELNNMPAYYFEAGGSFNYQFDGEGTLDLLAQGEMNSLERLIDWVDIDLTTLGTARANAKITGSLNEPVIEELALNTINSDGLAVELSGDLAWDGSNTLKDRLELKLSGPSLAVLEEWLGPVPYEPGAWQASAVLRTTAEGFSLNQIIVNAGDSERLRLHAEGRIGKILDLAGAGLTAIEEVDLSMSVHTDDVASLARLAGVELPEFQNTSGHWRIFGKGERLALSDGVLTVHDSDLDAQIFDVKATILPAENAPIRNISARVNLALSDTAALSQYFAREIPVLGSVSASGFLKQSGENFRLEKISAQLRGDNGMELSSRGEIGDLMKLEQVNLQNRFSEIDTGALLTWALPGFQHANELGHIAGEFLLVSKHEKLDLIELMLAEGPESSLELKIHGEVHDLLGLPSAELTAELAIDDPQLLAQFTGLELKPTRAKANINANQNHIEVAVEGDVGTTAVQLGSTLQIREGEVVALDVLVKSPHLQLRDFNLQSREDSSGERYMPAEELQEKITKGALERLVEFIPEYPTDIEIEIDQLSGDILNLNKIDVHLTGINGRHTLRKFSVSYDNTTAELRGVIDFNPTLPTFSLGGEFLAVDMNRLIKDLGIDSDIEGTLSVRTGLTATGLHSDELLHSLSGSLAFALEDAEIKGAAYDVLATDFLGWLYSGA
ncbi:MAG: AsmA-like C-terminal region-containing protein, partial [Halioglobus sp.]